AVQMPANFDHPSHAVAAEVRQEPAFRHALEGIADAARNVLPPERYATMLERLGYVEQEVRLAVYGHRLASRGDGVRWGEEGLCPHRRGAPPRAGRVRGVPRALPGAAARAAPRRAAVLLHVQADSHLGSALKGGRSMRCMLVLAISTLLGLAAGRSMAADAVWEIDPAHSSV